MTEEESQDKQHLLDQIVEIIGEENLSNSSDTNLKTCLKILEEMAEEKGLDYIKENKFFIIDQIEKTDNMF